MLTLIPDNLIYKKTEVAYLPLFFVAIEKRKTNRSLKSVGLIYILLLLHNVVTQYTYTIQLQCLVYKLAY